MIRPEILSNGEIESAWDIIHRTEFTYQPTKPELLSMRQESLIRAQRDKDYKEMLGQIIQWSNELCPHGVTKHTKGYAKKDCSECWQTLISQLESEMEGYPETLEGYIHKAFHLIAEKYNLDVDLVAEIIKDYDSFMSSHLERKIIIEEN